MAGLIFFVGIRIYDRKSRLENIMFCTRLRRRVLSAHVKIRFLMYANTRQICSEWPITAPEWCTLSNC